jgi:hypothetical protein
MKAAHWRGALPAFAVMLLLAYCQHGVAQGPNLALGKPAIYESSRWNDQVRYDAANVTDGIVCEDDQHEGNYRNPPDDTVSSYWLGAEGKKGEYLVVDLQAPTLITEIHLRNTHNAQYNDRNTMDFQIDASNDGIQVFTCTAGRQSVTNTDLVNPVTILTGTLSNVDGTGSCLNGDEIQPDIFDKTTGLNTGGQKFRYLLFKAINSYHSSNNVGLNELEVYGSQ